MIEVNIVVATFVALLALRGLNGLLGTVVQYVQSRKMQRELDTGHLSFTDGALLRLVLKHYRLTRPEHLHVSLVSAVYVGTEEPMFMLRFGTNIPPLKEVSNDTDVRKE